MMARRTATVVDGASGRGAMTMATLVAAPLVTTRHGDAGTHGSEEDAKQNESNRYFCVTSGSGE